jgi:phosphonate transport system ATP-binding protein
VGLALTQPEDQAGAAKLRLVVMEPKAVSVRGLVKRFDSGLTVHSGLDLDIATGSRVAIIGANGTGKSTLVRMLVRLVEPTDGRIVVLGQDVRALDGRQLKQLRASVGFVFQKHNLVTRLSALSNVVHGVQSRMSGPRSWGQAFAPRAVREEALACLDRVGLADKATSRIDQLSGGQSQRVAVARMLMQRPKLVIADEPDASLDPKAGEDVMALLTSLAVADGATLIFVSHRMEHAIRFADRIVGLGGGTVAFDKPAAACSEAELIRFFDHG